MDAAGLRYRLIEHGPVRSLAEAAAARGVEPVDVVKSIVVRRGPDDYVIVLVPGDRVIAWARLRAAVGANRLALPDAVEALAVTGYERGTITPFGTSRTMQVIADERLRGRSGITLGAGDHGVAVIATGDDVITATQALVADITDAQDPLTT